MELTIMLNIKVLRNPANHEIRKRKVPGEANVAIVHDKTGMLLHLEFLSINSHRLSSFYIL
jgi:hypothetical protein